MGLAHSETAFLKFKQLLNYKQNMDVLRIRQKLAYWHIGDSIWQQWESRM